MSKKKELLIPWHAATGQMAQRENDPVWWKQKDGSEALYLPAKPFFARMSLVGFGAYAQHGSAYLQEVDRIACDGPTPGSTLGLPLPSRRFSMFLSGVEKLLRIALDFRLDDCNSSCIAGWWMPIKRGRAYGIEYLGENEEMIETIRSFYEA